ncbi:ADP-glyceromanno-heptose 6-epimerase [Taibaiella koreensis]|uniref:ADP-glyceromanno-heptose 6-epimerase n=1 Tax=Taibaiella koreensis TaxID=1268548 RepID=UPI000E599AFF|nr:ADP-glyceromanno-heptose 6-epimerase [Taibaiella koreensis]
MGTEDVIAITGAAGFIGSCLVAHLNHLGFEQLVLVDDFSDEKKVFNLRDSKYLYKVHREQFAEWLKTHPDKIKAVFHLGARTDTTDPDYEVFRTLNLEYSKGIWEYCVAHHVPLVYASSAATYGKGEQGYKDDEALIPKLKPLNAYGISKNEFDIWALEQKHRPPFWAGLKFFNVYGPNEYHKGRMASVMFHAYQQIKDRGYIRLFRSHNPEYKDGAQLRDFIYVKDLLSVMVWLMKQRPQNGIYNLGTGVARTFNDLANTLFSVLNIPGKIEYIDTPEDIRENYQYYTEADMSKLREAGYDQPFFTLEQGIADYLVRYLELARYYS